MSIALNHDDMGHNRDARLAERLELYTETEGMLSADKTEPVLVHNMSVGGMLLESETVLSTGQRIHVRLPHVGLTPAYVMWCSDALYGCRFETPLSTDDVRATGAQDPMVTVYGDTAQQADNDGPDVNDFAVRLRALREARGLSLAALSRRAGISKPSIWAWETGKTVPRTRSVDALAKALGVTSAEIWGRDAPYALVSTLRQTSEASAVQSFSGLKDVVATARAAIAKAAAVPPENIRITIDY